MEKRVLLAVFLSFLVLFVYQAIFAPAPPDAERQPVAPEMEAATEPPVVRPIPDVLEPSPLDASAAETERAGGTEETETAVSVLVGDSVARDIVVDTPVVRAVFTNRGAQLRSWKLKDYLDAAGEPVDLVPARLPEELPRPLGLTLNDAQLTARLDAALFQPSVDSLDLTNEGGALAFEYADDQGLEAYKSLRFDPALPYQVAVEVRVEDQGQALNPAIRWGTGVGAASTVTGGSRYSQASQGIFLRDGDVSRLTAGDLTEQNTYEGLFRFVGVDDHYFLSAALPSGPVRIDYGSQEVAAASADTSEAMAMVVVGYRLAFSTPTPEAHFFFGPKDFDVLRVNDPELVRTIHFGWFSFLVVPLLRALKWINGFVGNYGWSIIILTVLLNAAMFPLRHKSVVSMRKMQELQPEMKAIQDRYAKLKTTDPARQKMNTELMNLYRERGVNPASGCFPMILTMPVLFAFYSLLSVAIEIRGAPFILWIQDLSLHDPMYVTPILMGITMVVQQRMTPSTADPTQQKIMMFMPIMFTFMFLWAPSGLVLYWLVSNVWGVGQQVVTNRIIGPPIVRAVRPPAERRVKRVGAGQTSQRKKQG